MGANRPPGGVECRLGSSIIKTAFPKKTNYPNISTTIRGSQFHGIREKAGLSKTGVSCRQLDQNDKSGIDFFFNSRTINATM